MENEHVNLERICFTNVSQYPSSSPPPSSIPELFEASELANFPLALQSSGVYHGWLARNVSSAAILVVGYLQPFQ